MTALAGRLADVRFIGPVMGRYTLESRVRLPGVQIFALRLQSISPTMLVASAPVLGRIGEQATAHFIPFGNVRGKIARHIDGGFVIDIDGEPHDRKRLAAKIEWYKKRTFSGLSDKRAHARFMPREPKSAVVFHDGTVRACLVIDLSSSGAAISVDHEPVVGEPLAVGKIVARVVRTLDVGFAVQFVTPEDRETVEEMLRAPEEWAKAMRMQEEAAAVEPAAETAAGGSPEADYSI